MILRRRRHAGQVGDVGIDVVVDGRGAFIVQRLRDQHEPVERNIDIAGQHPVGEIGRPRRAEAFADKVFRRVPALVVGDPDTDEFRDGAAIAFLAPVILVLALADGAAIAGGDRVDEHEVGHVEDRQRIVEQRVWGGAVIGVRVARHLHALRAEQAHVQPDRSRPRPAVEDERDRARAADVFADVGDGEQARAGLAFGVPDKGLTRFHAVADLLSAEGAGMGGLEHYRFRNGLCGFLRFGLFVSRLAGGWFGEGRAGRSDQQRKDQGVEFHVGVQPLSFGRAGLSTWLARRLNLKAKLKPTSSARQTPAFAQLTLTATSALTRSTGCLCLLSNRQGGS